MSTPRPLRSVACEARRLVDYPGWAPRLRGVRPRSLALPSDAAPPPLDEATLLFVHQDGQVTLGVEPDENVVFASDDPTWVEFCQRRLGLTIRPVP